MGTEVNPTASATQNSNLELKTEHAGIWETEVGNGLRKGTFEFGVAAAHGFGLGLTQNDLKHDLALATVSFGRVMSGLVAESHWFAGNWQLAGEIFGGGQYRPDGAYLFGLTPILRYNFATGSRWVPFVEGGIGPTVTDIGLPDLSTTFQFNDQIGGGTRYFWSDSCAISLHVRYLHISNGGMKDPNFGVNSLVVMLGTTWLF
jgi:hypothetical protein